MKISYNWLKWYIPDAPKAEKLSDIFTYHVAEVETVEKLADGDYVFDIKILPNRAHDLLSHLGIAKELSSLLNIPFTDPEPKYKIPASAKASAGKPELKIDVQSSNCRRYMGRIIRGVKVGPSPEWVVKHLESIGQRSINNLVDAANLVMYNTGQPAHVFDLDKLEGGLVIRQAVKGEKMTTLDNRNLELNEQDMVVADEKHALGLAGIKGGKLAEVGNGTINVIIEIANFEPVTTRKSAVRANIFTDARKRFENDLSPELAPYAMTELSALILEMCPEAVFEEIVDTYPRKQEERKLNFSVEKIAKILGTQVSAIEIGNILERYKIGYKNEGDNFEILVPPMRLDLTMEEDMAEEIGRIIGYDKVKPQIPKINFKPKVNETYAKIFCARSKLLTDGYSEVMTYAFRDKGEVEVMQSASDKKFLRVNLADGLVESLKLNKINAPFLGPSQVKIFEIGAVFAKKGEEIHVAWNEKDKIIEKTLEEFVQPMKENFAALPASGLRHGLNFPSAAFHPWSLFPFISRDISVWVPNEEDASSLKKLLKENATDLSVKEPYLLDSFKKDNRTSFAFRLVFQSYDRTLTDGEVNDVMNKIGELVKEKGWEVR